MSGSAAGPAHPARDRAGDGGAAGSPGAEAAGGREPLPLTATDVQVRAVLADYEIGRASCRERV